MLTIDSGLCFEFLMFWLCNMHRIISDWWQMRVTVVYVWSIFDLQIATFSYITWSLHPLKSTRITIFCHLEPHKLTLKLINLKFDSDANDFFYHVTPHAEIGGRWKWCGVGIWENCFFWFLECTHISPWEAWLGTQCSQKTNLGVKFFCESFWPRCYVSLIFTLKSHFQWPIWVRTQYWINRKCIFSSCEQANWFLQKLEGTHRVRTHVVLLLSVKCVLI